MIVVNWNDLGASVECLRSVLQASPDAMPILVDNGSPEDATAECRRLLPGVRVLRLSENRGYAGGCNAGAEAAIADGAGYLLLLNNDTVLEADTIPALLRAHERHPDTILAPKIVYADAPEVVWSAGGRVWGALLENEHVGKGDDTSLHTRPGPVDWASGCALFLSVDTYRRLGPMDERYFLYLEDVDWCLRGRRAGIATWFVPEAVVRHQVSRTLRSERWSPHVRYYAYRNKYGLALRQGRPALRPLVIADAVWTLLKALARSALSSPYRRDAYYHMRTRAVLDFLRGRWGPLPAPSAAPAVPAVGAVP